MNHHFSAKPLLLFRKKHQNLMSYIMIEKTRTATTFPYPKLTLRITNSSGQLGSARHLGSQNQNPEVDCRLPAKGSTGAAAPANTEVELAMERWPGLKARLSGIARTRKAVPSLP